MMHVKKLLKKAVTVFSKTLRRAELSQVESSQEPKQASEPTSNKNYCIYVLFMRKEIVHDKITAFH